MKLSEEYAVIRGIKEVNGQPMFNEDIKPKIILLEDEIAVLNRMLKGERKVAKHHANVINAARRLCNEGDEQIAALKQEIEQLQSCSMFSDAFLYTMRRLRRDDLLTAEEQGD